MEMIDVFFNDLSKAKQDEVLKVFGVQSPDEMNWDVIPITTIAFEE